MKVHELIKKKRQELKETGKVFGARFNRSHAAISYWEHDKGDPPREVINFCLEGKEIYEIQKS